VKDDHVERRAVKLGASRGSETEILAGLVAGDTVVVSGPADLHDGETIAVKR
jgi:multidrug efflux pump subunit AcrA (membrane-fusion protein)